MGRVFMVRCKSMQRNSMRLLKKRPGATGGVWLLWKGRRGGCWSSLGLVTSEDRGLLPGMGQHLQEGEMMVFQRSCHDKNYSLWRQNKSRAEETQLQLCYLGSLTATWKIAKGKQKYFIWSSVSSNKSILFSRRNAVPLPLLTVLCGLLESKST